MPERTRLAVNKNLDITSAPWFLIISALSWFKHILEHLIFVVQHMHFQSAPSACPDIDSGRWMTLKLPNSVAKYFYCPLVAGLWSRSYIPLYINIWFKIYLLFDLTWGCSHILAKRTTWKLFEIFYQQTALYTSHHCRWSFYQTSDIFIDFLKCNDNTNKNKKCITARSVICWRDCYSTNQVKIF